jgi:NAD+ synthase (glutamine-hydrolysing)
MILQPIKVAGACLNQTPLDWAQNLQNILDAIQAAKAAGVALLCLPELAICGYGCEDTFFSDYVAEQSILSLRTIVRETENIAVCVGLPMNFENCLYNTVAMMANGELLGFSAKQELAGDGIHYEPRWFKPWQDGRWETIVLDGATFPFGDLIYDIGHVRVGFEICEDAWNGVRPAQKHYLSNVDIILNPSASHFAFGKSHLRQMLVTEASRAFSCAYIYSNLLGNESGRIIYDGEILISQAGELLARNRRFSYQQFGLSTAVIDLAGPRRQKKKSFNFQPEIKSEIIVSDWKMPVSTLPVGPGEIAPTESKFEEFYRAETLALFDYMRKSKSRGFALSLSGGADSGACAVLAAHSLQNAIAELGETEVFKRIAYWPIDSATPLSKQLLTCVYQGTENSSTETENSARQLAQELGATYYNWNVQPLFGQYTQLVADSLGRSLDWAQDDIALQNIQARLRAPGIWMIANLKNALLLTTSNRSEAAVGYATMDGDTAGSLAPLGGIDKATLIQWLQWAETALPVKNLCYVNNLQPSAELRPQNQAQTDEKDLMPYPILDKIEKYFIRDYRSPVEVFIQLRGSYPDADLHRYIEKFYRLWARNQWKRERYAPAFHLDDENLDPRTWCRFPILNGEYQAELAELNRYVSALKTAHK